MSFSDYVSIAAGIFSILAFVISLITSTKKYGLSTSLRCDIMVWHKETVTVLIKIREHLCADIEFDKIDYLAQLSALIEQGRFYFPNIKLNIKGSQKPTAYQGNRNVILEFLIFSYDIIKSENAKTYTDHLYRLQREFTSRIFDIIQPRKYNRLVKRFTNIPLNKTVTTLEFKESNPELYEFYRNNEKK
jgi:hypothetical protein